MDEQTLIKQQIEYYQARSPEYDEWILRTGRYDRGDESNGRWFSDLEMLRRELELSNPSGRILELACGTGYWTQFLAPMADELVAVDSSATSLALNEKRVASDRVRYVDADIFGWEPTDRFDYIFFGFWLSHVPASQFDAFWDKVSRALAPGGHVFFVDSLPQQEATASDQEPIDGTGRARRRLNDGREFEIVKVYYDPSDLESRLDMKGWQGYVRATKFFFLYGCVQLL